MAVESPIALPRERERAPCCADCERRRARRADAGPRVATAGCAGRVRGRAPSAPSRCRARRGRGSRWVDRLEVGCDSPLAAASLSRRTHDGDLRACQWSQRTGVPAQAVRRAGHRGSRSPWSATVRQRVHILEPVGRLSKATARGAESEDLCRAPVVCSPTVAVVHTNRRRSDQLFRSRLRVKPCTTWKDLSEGRRGVASPPLRLGPDLATSSVTSRRMVSKVAGW
jgi:hypothetical protein